MRQAEAILKVDLKKNIKKVSIYNAFNLHFFVEDLEYFKLELTVRL